MAWHNSYWQHAPVHVISPGDNHRTRLSFDTRNTRDMQAPNVELHSLTLKYFPIDIIQLTQSESN